ncbi:hypothetical protein CDD82_5898 [Ophiocordyceps australis]|uniref:Phenolic acid decarboxylase n=1 Tax=Ophiocordyceps australis TaxID=1399860 RepID=A0A2C5YXX2_9HYPO|nr:hypothetical protein CDD82_5898 [Ophiocordyceps australis]
MSSDFLSLPCYISHTKLDESFGRDMQNVHIIYEYSTQDKTENPSKWRYEIWFPYSTRIVYAIHGGPMAGRTNYQKAAYQCIRPGELWQVNWLEETGTICSLVFDMVKQRITTLVAFSQGHWERRAEAVGDKRNQSDFERWRMLAKDGIQTDRLMLSVQGDVVEIFKGQGDLMPICEHDATL